MHEALFYKDENPQKTACDRIWLCEGKSALLTAEQLDQLRRATLSDAIYSLLVEMFPSLNQNTTASHDKETV